MEQTRNGFYTETKYIGLPDPVTFGDWLDEGLVEILAQQTTKEYVRRTGSYQGCSEKDVVEYFELAAKLEKGGRNREVRLLQVLIEIVSSILNVDKKLIFEAFIQSYASGEELFSPELKKQFEAAGKLADYNKSKKLSGTSVFSSHKVLDPEEAEEQWHQRYLDLYELLVEMRNELNDGNVIVTETQ